MPPSLVIYMAKGAPNSCGPGCERWIAIEGKVDADAAARVSRFMRRIKGQLPPIYLYSPGGVVEQAYPIGRLLRERKASFGDVRWVVAGARPLPFADQCFDVVFAGELIEHLPDPVEGLDEFRRVLRPGGRLILTTPNRLRLANVADRSERPYSPDHLSELSYDEVRRLLPECIGVFIQPPSVAELERRMRSRGQDADEVIRRRLASAEEEMSHAPEFNYVIINKDFDEAKRDLQAIIRVERLKKSRL